MTGPPELPLLIERCRSVLGLVAGMDIMSDTTNRLATTGAIKWDRKAHQAYCLPEANVCDR